MPSEDLVGTQPMQAISTGSSMPSASAALDEAIKNPGQMPLSADIVRSPGAKNKAELSATGSTPSMLDQSAQALEPTEVNLNTLGASRAGASSDNELTQSTQTHKQSVLPSSMPMQTGGEKLVDSSASPQAQVDLELEHGTPAATRAAPSLEPQPGSIAPLAFSTETPPSSDVDALGNPSVPSTSVASTEVDQRMRAQVLGPVDTGGVMSSAVVAEDELRDVESGKQGVAAEVTTTTAAASELDASALSVRSSAVNQLAPRRANEAEKVDQDQEREAGSATVSTVTVPTSSATERVTTELTDSMVSDQAQQDLAPDATAARAQQSRPGMVISMDRQGADAKSEAVSEVGTVSKTPVPVSQESWTVGQQDASTQDARSAESTFASSFVQALMGQGHHGVAQHSQPLEVVPAPLPMAPHQVRLDAGQVQVEVVRLVKQGGGQVVMELTPPDESKFKIDLSISQQGVARLVVDGASESTRWRLEQTVSGLQDQFQQMGLQLQLDMRQSHQQEPRAQADTLALDGVDTPRGTSRPEVSVLQQVSARPSWEQGQVYLVA